MCEPRFVVPIPCPGGKARRNSSSIQVHYRFITKECSHSLWRSRIQRRPISRGQENRELRSKRHFKLRTVEEGGKEKGKEGRGEEKLSTVLSN